MPNHQPAQITIPHNKLKVLTRRCYGIRLLDTLTRRLRLDLRNDGAARA